MRIPATLALLLALFGGTSQAQSADPATLYRNVTIIDGTGAAPKPGMNLLIRGERIVSLGADAPTGGDIKVVDASGLYVLPGLINTHEHLATPPNRAYAEAQMKRDLYGGVTSVRDMADDLRQVGDLARAARAREIPGPDLYYAALMAGPDFFGDPRTQAVSVGGVPGQVPWMQSIGPDTDLVQAVAMARGTWASAIKIYADLPAERVAAITAEAHRQGIPVWAHAAVFPASPAQVLAAGVDAVSHVCMLAYQASDAMPGAYHARAPVDASKFAASDSPVTAALFRTMRARGVPLDATLLVYDELDRAHAAHPERPAGYCSLDLAARLTAQARREGVIVTAGTDTLGDPADPWPALYREMALLVDRAGFTPLQAIRAATGDAALAIRHDPDFGTLAPGKLANLVFLAKDPSTDIGAMRTVAFTVKRGLTYPRADYHPDADRAARKED